MIHEKENFIKVDFIELIDKLPSTQIAKWGKMDAQQMIEHLIHFFALSYGKLYMAQITPNEHLPKYMEFLLSDKEFKENTKAAMLPEEPNPYEYTSFEEAKDILKSAVQHFFDYYENEHHKKALHPVFGELDYYQWVQLHYKHLLHHLKQFGLI